MEKKNYVQPEVKMISFGADDYCDFIPVSGPVEADAPHMIVDDTWDE